MTQPRPGSGAALPSFLAERARSSSDTRLALDALVGVVLAVATWLVQPVAWVVLLSVAICLFAYGVWGIADRELGERTVKSGRHVSTLVAVRVIAAAVGVGAALTALFGGLSLVLGRWQS